MSAEYGREFGKGKRFGRGRGQNSEGGLILYLGGQAGGRRLQYGISGGYTRNGKTSRNRKFTGPGFTFSIPPLKLCSISKRVPEMHNPLNPVIHYALLRHYRSSTTANNRMIGSAIQSEAVKVGFLFGISPRG